MIQGFDAAMYGMVIGDKKTVTIPAAEAYGERFRPNALLREMAAKGQKFFG